MYLKKLTEEAKEIASDGDFGPTRSSIRNLNGLSETEYPDSVIDQHLEEAFEAVEAALKITIATSAQTFTNEVFNSRDLKFDNAITNRGYVYSDYSSIRKDTKTILYFGDFLQTLNRLPILTITSMETRTDDGASYETKTSGQLNDYIVDTIANRIIFNHELTRDGYQNVRISGTYGVVASPMTSLNFKYKNYIALIAAIRGLEYATGSGHNEAKTISLGSTSITKDEYASVSNASYNRLIDSLDRHLSQYGLVKKRIVMTIA